MLHPSVPLYNIGGYIQIDGAVYPKLFEQAINFLVQRHDALRTVLVLRAIKGARVELFFKHYNLYKNPILKIKSSLAPFSTLCC
jgi:hypothetical protein